MRKTFLGLAVIAAIATPLAFASSANAAVSTAPDCQPVKAAAAWTETFYKYVPAGKPSDGPTQWDTVDAKAGTHKTWIVKGKPVDYVRDGNKTSTLAHPAVDEVTCDATSTIDLPDEFDIKHTEDPAGTYWATKVTKSFTNTTDVDYVINVANADVQDSDRVWVERTVFDNWYHEVVIPAHETKTVTFDVWYNVVSDSPDVPDDLTLTYTVTKNFTWA